MFNRFSILSDELLYDRRMKNDAEWIVEVEQHNKVNGTAIFLEIDVNPVYTTKEIFDKYTDDEFRFLRTHIPLTLAKYGDELLISRSQAKRVLSGFDKFSEIILDFSGINQIGQAFADEIFRVFKNEHPHIIIYTVGTCPAVDAMIYHVSAQK